MEMEFDAFRKGLGRSQGRLPTPDGHVFVLGSLRPGVFHPLVPGDHAELLQEVDLTDVDLIRTELHFTVPASLPQGLAWEASLLIDGSKHARMICPAGRRRHTTDLAANVSKMTGLHRVGVRLELVDSGE